ncbi:MAG: hypothetical protein M1833_002264 [Piccolia ochrophora]|nr:MAG: hypothetical protein M1833_002264 [Piccolia ochrophora]
MASELVSVADEHDPNRRRIESLTPGGLSTATLGREFFERQNRGASLDVPTVRSYLKMLDRSVYYCGTGGELDPSQLPETKESDLLARPVHNSAGELYSIRINDQWFARKSVWTRAEFRRRSFKRELENLRKLRENQHIHIIQLQCYSFGTLTGDLILSPLALCDLSVFMLLEPSPWHRKCLAKWIGCLADGLSHIHAAKLKHKDIKPANLLVHQENIVFTDFDICHSFTDDSKTTGASNGSLIYKAPEVRGLTKRGRKQDVWSLIQFHDFCTNSSQEFYFDRRFHKVIEWVKELKNLAIATDEDRAMLDLVLDAFHRENADARPNAANLRDRIRAISPKYTGRCCSVRGAPEPSAGEQNHPSSQSPSDYDVGTVGHCAKHMLSGLRESLNPSFGDKIFADIETQVLRGYCSTLRALETIALQHVAPSYCSNADDWLQFCNRFVGELLEAVGSHQYSACENNPDTGEEWGYTTAYFMILIDNIGHIARTKYGGSQSFDSSQIKKIEAAALPTEALVDLDMQLRLVSPRGSSLTP